VKVLGFVMVLSFEMESGLCFGVVLWFELGMVMVMLLCLCVVMVMVYCLCVVMV
jgi:hypothetical protein